MLPLGGRAGSLRLNDIKMQSLLMAGENESTFEVLYMLCGESILGVSGAG